MWSCLLTDMEDDTWACGSKWEWVWAEQNTCRYCLFRHRHHIAEQKEQKVGWILIIKVLKVRKRSWNLISPESILGDYLMRKCEKAIEETQAWNNEMWGLRNGKKNGKNGLTWGHVSQDKFWFEGYWVWEVKERKESKMTQMFLTWEAAQCCWHMWEWRH